ncbi:zinc finger C3H1 domain-containing protein isoform X2 [Engraulis encrasicolus]|uniref:zinc finger C3H1 domain-containing protein isoform X2 n=1 Tax=Engraulis encrasicolus TaxID=184585 RepID=UPI002FD54756
MDVNPGTQSPREEGELEDGEICDDETDEKQLTREGMRPRNANSTRPNRKCKGPVRTLPPPMGSQAQDFRVMMPFNRVPHLHGHFPPMHRQQIGPSGPDRLLPGEECDQSQRSSFWERSHHTFGKLRNRGGKPVNDGRGDWARGGRGDGVGGPRENGRPPVSRYAFGDSHVNRKESPQRKQKPFGRNQGKKQIVQVVHNAPKAENGMEDSFEDLLFKYKQIQLELECIRKEEKMALQPVDPKQEGSGASVTPTPGAETDKDKVVEVVEEAGVSAEQPQELEQQPPEKEEIKTFQAFNLKPLRQKLLTPAERDALNAKGGKEEETKEEKEEAVVVEQATAVNEASAVSEAAEEDDEDLEDTESDLNISCLSTSDDSLLKKKVKGKDEDDELSELQLRLLALQSASRKWQAKEQQVMKESKEKITKAQSGAKPSSSSSSSSHPPDKSSSPQGQGQPDHRTKMVTRSSAERGKAATTTTTSATSSSSSSSSSKPQEKGKPTTADNKGKAGNKNHTGPGKKSVSPGSAAKQAWRKQQLRAWKLQQQREQEEQARRRQEEEEERRKREEEIRKIRDLSNQDEQYNRFMKLVGGKHHPRPKSVDNEHRKSLSKQGLDTSGNLYQYDNYDEVAMDTDSEPESPGVSSSPVPDPFSMDMAMGIPHMMGFPLHSTPLGMELVQHHLDPLGLAQPSPPPPLPPMPPPDEQERPPKPPFADEEEEEEMLLRKELLKSLATKRAAKPEDTVSSSSGPPSPVVRQIILPMSRTNLSAVNLNTVISQHRHASSKYSQANPALRGPAMLPRHKPVVVQINGSDDSDSDSESTSSPPTTSGFFGGLEFMIKEARRTAEASKPKGSKSEKENMPDSKKLELASHLQRMSRLDAVKGASSPVGSDSELDTAAKSAVLRLAEAEEKLTKHRSQLERDEVLLKQLLHQELRKKEILRAAEAKVAKLREQLQAQEKIVTINRVLLKKQQEQMHRIQHRIVLKKQQALRLEKDVAQAQASAHGTTLKRKNDSPHYSPVKMLRTEGHQRHYADLIAQKQRLQQLEAEYALKIQKLKEEQALRQQAEQRISATNAAAAAAAAAAATAAAVVTVPQQPHRHTPTSPYALPQPSLHDLTQDKLALASEDADTEEDEQQPPSFITASTSSPVSSANMAAGGGVAMPVATPSTPTSRRRSFRDSGAFTKPKLQVPRALHTSTPAKLGMPAVPLPAKPAAATAKASSGGVAPGLPELCLGLTAQELKQRYQQSATSVEDLLQSELTTLGGATRELPCGKTIPVDVDPAVVSAPASRVELKPVPFGTYHSPLLAFKSYRFSPYFRTKEKLSLSSVSYSNVIEAKKCFCRFDLTGTCNDDDCQWQHMRNCTLSGNQLFQDILSYQLPLIGCSDNSSSEEVRLATEKYIKKLFGANRDRMGTDQKAVLLVSKVNESKAHVPPFTTCKERRTWRPEPQRPPRSEDTSDGEEGPEEAPSQNQYDTKTKSNPLALDVCVNPDDKRYFDSETDDISNLETAVLDSPQDVQLWIKLAFKYLNQKEIPVTERLDAALNTLSRALEDNREDAEVWCHYLTLFSRRGSRDEMQEMCEMAVQHAPSYHVWWTYMSMESSFEGKDFVCGRMLQHLLQTPDGDGEPLLRSFRLLESLLYRAQLSLFTGRRQNALDILQNALKGEGEQNLAAQLSSGDRALAWLCLLHVTEFGQLPSGLCDPADSGPSRVVCTKPDPFPWSSATTLRTPADQLVGLFQDAIRGCSEEGLPHTEEAEAVAESETPSSSSSAPPPPLPSLHLHTELVALYRHLDRLDEAVAHCEGVLARSPDCCPLLERLAELCVARGDAEGALAVWTQALRLRPHNATLLYHTCSFLQRQERSSEIEPLFRTLMLSLCEPAQDDLCPVHVLRHLLGLPRDAILHPPRVKASLQATVRQQLPYLSLLHCTWQSVQGAIPDALDAFESALGSLMELELVQKIWMDYLLFASGKLVGPLPCARDLKLFSDLVQRCLVSVPTRLTVPHSATRYWSCYHFHNQVISFYLGCLPQSQHLTVLERLRQAMPTNVQLSIRLLQQERRDGSTEHLRFQSRGLCGSLPLCLPHWRIAIAVEREQKGRAEVRRLYQHALQKLPLCATLWKDRLLFEATEGGKTDTLKKLVDKCQELGVSLTEVLQLSVQ